MANKARSSTRLVPFLLLLLFVGIAGRAVAGSKGDDKGEQSAAKQANQNAVYLAILNALPKSSPQPLPVVHGSNPNDF